MKESAILICGTDKDIYNYVDDVKVENCIICHRKVYSSRKGVSEDFYREGFVQDVNEKDFSGGITHICVDCLLHLTELGIKLIELKKGRSKEDNNIN